MEVYPSAWSEWEWREELATYWRYRLGANGSNVLGVFCPHDNISDR